MSKYLIRDICVEDYRRVVEIYNSNRLFLLEHLGLERIDKAFVSQEISVIRGLGFCSCVVVNEEEQTVQGVLDYKYGEEVYLSLLMLADDLQGEGIGRDIYACFEADMLRRGCDSIRIDVVKGCCGNASSFWKSLGFLECGPVVLEWGEKSSEAVVMRKHIRQ